MLKSEKAIRCDGPLLQPIQIDVIRSRQAFEALAPEWNELMTRSDASIFNSAAWLIPWVQFLGEEVELVTLVARSVDGQLVGLWPLIRENVKNGMLRHRRITFAGETFVGSDYLDVVTDEKIRAQILSSFMPTLHSFLSDVDTIELGEISETSDTLGFLRSSFEQKLFQVDVNERFVCPFEPLNSSPSFEAFLKTTARKDNFSRRRRWLENQKGFVVRVHSSPDGLEEIMSDFLRLHAERWALEGGSSGIRNAQVEAFHRAATRNLAKLGKLRMLIMTLNDQPVAIVYGIVHAGKFHYYQAGYSPKWASKSVGMVLVGESFRSAIGEHLSEFDFLRGTEAYKFDWVKHTRRTVSVTVYKRGSRGERITRALEWWKATKSRARQALPAKWLPVVRRMTSALRRSQL